MPRDRRDGCGTRSNEQACCAGEAAGLAALEHVIDTFAEGQQSAIVHCLDEFGAAALQPWADLAELMWQFDAHVQDRLAALSESQAIGYQLGRGLADTYWALNPGQEHGSASWSFLLGQRRCGELSRLTGRLAVYMGEYTAPAIAGSLEVWKAVVSTPGWLGDAQGSGQALYSLVRADRPRAGPHHADRPRGRDAELPDAGPGLPAVLAPAAGHRVRRRRADHPAVPGQRGRRHGLGEDPVRLQRRSATAR